MADDTDVGAAGEAGLEGDGEASNAALLAELEAENRQAPPAKPKAAPVADDDDEDEPDTDDADDEGADEDELTDADEDELTDEPDTTKDPELAKRLAAVQRTEQRRREAFERERGDFDRERTAFQADAKQLREQHQRFEKLAARAKYDSYSVLRELGVPDEDMGLHAKHLYARSKDAGVKPEHRAAADQALREREDAEERAALRKELEELKSGLTTREQQAAAEAAANAYVGRIAKVAISDKLEAPLVKARIVANPRAAREALTATAFRLAQKHGALPRPVAVIRAHEKELADLRRELGVDGVDSSAKPVTPPAAKGKAPVPKSATKVVTSPAESPADDGGEVRHPSRDELLRELRSGAAT